jgi:ribosomal protein S18 acetylase RimI-like enzyme
MEATRRYYAQQMVAANNCFALGAFLDGEMVGFIYAGIFHGVLNDFIRKNRLFLAGRVIVRPWLLLDPLFRDAIRLAVRKLTQKKHAVTIAHATRPQDQPFVILSIAVDPDHQRAGVGQLLMDAAEEEALRGGFQRMSLTVNLDNAKAIRFYKNIGWAIDRNASSRSIEMIKQLK